MAVILAFDPAASTGYSVVKIESGVGTITEYGFIDVDTSSGYIGDWCLDLERQIQLLYEKIQPDEIAVEDFFFSSRFTSGVNVNTAYRTAIHMWIRRFKKHYEILNISSWKIFVAGRTTANKTEKKQWGVQAAKKILIAKALRDRWCIELPTYSYSSKTNKPIKFRYDISDAIAQGMYAAYVRYQCSKFTCSVSLPPIDSRFQHPF